MFLSCLSGIGGGGRGHYGICVNVKLNLAIFCMDQWQMCQFFMCREKVYKLE